VQDKIKKTIESQLRSYLRHLDKAYSLSRISPLLFRSIHDFVLRKGKRIRPILLTAGYLAFAKKPAANLYKTALSIELLHDFMLVHDDIIDKSDTRRCRPSMHKLFCGYLKRYNNIKFDGQDLAIVAGDVMYAMAIDTFLAIKEDPARKELALRKFIQAAIYTGMGEFIELLCAVKSLKNITKQDIYRIYDYKTAHYTFASPLAAGAILAGAARKQTDRLYKYGIYLGRAFQIKDDILGVFGQEKQIGKSTLTDLQEGKRTILIWLAFNSLDKKNKLVLKKILNSNRIKKDDLSKMQTLIKDSGALDSAEKEIANLLHKAKDIIRASAIRSEYKTFLNDYSQRLLD
jgi:geranylgeranyl diphosphate synthase type I